MLCGDRYWMVAHSVLYISVVSIVSSGSLVFAMGFRCMPLLAFGIAPGSGAHPHGCMRVLTHTQAIFFGVSVIESLVPTVNPRDTRAKLLTQLRPHSTLALLLA